MTTLALIGNPNCGKTTLFNAWTGTHQRVGNWPGVTVEQKVGDAELDGTPVKVVDLPGIYSLEQQTMGLDERIADEFLGSQEADCVINIIDAANVERHLVLTQQLLEMQIPVVIAVNMIDVAESLGIKVDTAALSKKLGVAVIPIVASTGVGLAALASAALGAQKTSAVELNETGDASERLVQRY